MADRAVAADATSGARLQTVASVATACAVATVGVLPMFLAGALGVLLRHDTGLSEFVFGLVIALFWLFSALSAVPAGRVLDRLPARISLVVGAFGSSVALLIVALADSWLLVAAGLALAGTSSAMCQLAAASYLAGAIRRDRQGLAFGIKQSAIPAATLLGGLAVPLAAVHIGWRAAFLVAAALALVIAALAFGRARRVASAPRAASVERPRILRRPILIMSVSAGIATAGATAVAAFLVEFLTLRTGDAVFSGYILAFGSVTAIASRVLLGVWADRRRREVLGLVAAMFAVGAVGVALLAMSTGTLVIVLAVILAYAIGWGWAGLLIYVVVREHPASPASATGMMQAGIWTGAMAGPVIFGALVAAADFELALFVTSAAFLLAAGVLGVGQRWIRRRWQEQGQLATTVKGHAS